MGIKEGIIFCRVKPLVAFLVVFCFVNPLFPQHQNTINATLKEDTHVIQIQQDFLYVNDSNDPLPSLYFNDWTHAYSSKKTPLNYFLLI